MIDYVEVRNNKFELLGIIDTASSIIWHSVYYGVGDFELYVQATPTAVGLLRIGRYITRPENREVGIIESLDFANNMQDGKMLTVSGRFAKSILDRRHIYRLSGTKNRATVLKGNVETNIRKVVSDNAISCSFDAKRNIGCLQLGELANISKIIVDENGDAAQKQVSYENLLTYTDEVLQEYEMSSLIILDEENAKLQYIIYEGADRSADNADGNEIIVFSQEFDNLTASAYQYSTTAEKNTALIGGAGEEEKRFYTLLQTGKTDLARKETWVDAKSINKTYTDDDEQEQTYTNAEYTAILKAEGRKDLSEKKITKAFSGTIDVTNSNWMINRDFWLGDKVTVQDNDIGLYINVRITETTEVQDENGYTIDVVYGE